MLLKMAKVIAYILFTYAILGVLAPMLISARSYEALAGGVVSGLAWLFLTAYLIEKLTKKKETKE